MSLPVAAQPMVFVLTRDRAISLPFYRDILGLALTGQDDFSAALDARGLALRLTTVPDHRASPHPVMGWEVTDIVAVSTALAAQGVTFHDYPGLTEGPLGIWSDPDRGVKLNWFSDPEGNVLSLSQHG